VVLWTLSVKLGLMVGALVAFSVVVFSEVRSVGTCVTKFDVVYRLSVGIISVRECVLVATMVDDIYVVLSVTGV